MQISENLLRVIFLLSTIVAVTDCCSSRLLLLKEHTLQIVQNRLHNINNDESDYDQYDDYDQLQQQQQQQLSLEQKQQQQKIPQYVGIINGDIEFNKTHTNEHKRSRDVNEDELNDTDRNILASGALQLEDLRLDEFESLLGIFDAAAFTTTTTTATSATLATTATTAKAAETTMTTTATSKTVVDSINTTTTAAEMATTTAATPTTTTAATTTNLSKTTVPSSTSASVESTTARTSTPVAEFNLAPPSSASATSTTLPTAAVKIGSEVASVMNDLKSARDLLSLPCSGQFNTEFCLNRGRCFRYPIGNDTIHSCICADGYIGERCESKSMNGSFVPSIAGAHKKKIVMARIVFSFPMLMALSVIYIMIGAAIVFKRPPAPSPLSEPSTYASSALSTSTSPMSAPYSSKETSFELWPGDDEAGEFIMMNSYPIALQAATVAASYSTYTD